MAVYTVETDYSCEMDYPFDNSRQIVKGLYNNYLDGRGGGGKLEGEHRREWQQERGELDVKFNTYMGGITFSFLFANWKSIGGLLV